MEPNSTNIINSVFSLKPLIRAWEKVIQNGRPGSQHVYTELLAKVNQYPELLEPITDDSVLEKHQPFIEEIMTSLFPVTLSDDEDLFGVSVPFQFKMVYTSKMLRALFLGELGCEVIIPDKEEGKKMSNEKKAAAYQLILGHVYNLTVKGKVSTIHLYKCPHTNLDKYLELELDTRFIDVKVKGELPSLPEDYMKSCYRVADLVEIPDLEEKLPLSLFEFEGMVIVQIREVTERESLNVIRNSLLETNNFSDRSVFFKLQAQVQNLLGIPG
jgi:hypothetical protein